MKKIILILIIFNILSHNIVSAGDKADSTKIKNAYAIWILPAMKTKIYGIGIGPFGSEVVCNNKQKVATHGFNIQLIGQGLFIPLNRKVFSYKNNLGTDSSHMVVEKDNIELLNVKNNGVLISMFGTFTNISNGIAISSWFSIGQILNGVGFNLFAGKYTFVNGVTISVSNETYQTKGLQVGLINRTRKLKGIQLGLWNINDKRKLPLINWNFKKSSNGRIRN